MDIEHLRLELRGLDAERLADLRAFILYRRLEKRQSAQLMELLLATAQPTTDRLLAAQLDAARGSYRNTKGELIGTVLEWRTLNANEWLAPYMRQLCMAHTQMQLGAAKDALVTVQKVQDSCELQGHYAVVRIALELKSALVQRSRPDNTSWTLSAIIEEMDGLANKASDLKICSTLYVHIGRLTDHSMLLRSKAAQVERQRLGRNMATYISQRPQIAFPAWAYRVQGEALLALFDGDVQFAFDRFHQLWLRMNADPMPIHPSEHRFYQFFQCYIELALEAREWHHALEANDLFGISIAHYFASNPQLMALHETFRVLTLVGHSPTDAHAQAEFRNLLGKLKSGRTVGHADFNLEHWNLHLSANVALMVVRKAYRLHWFDEATKILGLVRKFNAKNVSAAKDLQSIAPLIEIVLTIEALGKKSIPVGDKTFTHNCQSCYDLYRKKADSHPVEMELASLMRGLAYGGKDVADRFRKTSDNLALLRTTCPYYKALMQLFDFEGWVERRAGGRCPHHTFTPITHTSSV